MLSLSVRSCVGSSPVSSSVPATKPSPSILPNPISSSLSHSLRYRHSLVQPSPLSRSSLVGSLCAFSAQPRRTTTRLRVLERSHCERREMTETRRKVPGKVIGDDGKETMNCGESENWRCYCCGALCDVCIASRGASGQLALSGPIQLCVKKNSKKNLPPVAYHNLPLPLGFSIMWHMLV